MFNNKTNINTQHNPLQYFSRSLFDTINETHKNGINMAYTPEQIARFQTVPANKIYYDTISFENPNAEPLHLLVSGENGPYFPISFIIEGVSTEFMPVSCSIPEVTDQADDNKLGNVKFGRVGTEAYNFISEIAKNATTPIDKAISATIRRWEDGLEAPIFERVCYVDSSGPTLTESSVSMSLSVDNPALVYVVAFYDPAEYIGMAYSGQDE